jgi:hypothetical protein
MGGEATRLLCCSAALLEFSRLSGGIMLIEESSADNLAQSCHSRHVNGCLPRLISSDNEE